MRGLFNEDDETRKQLIRNLMSRTQNPFESLLLQRAMLLGWDPRKKESMNVRIMQTPGNPSPLLTPDMGNIGPRTLAQLDAVSRAIMNWMPVPAF